MIFIKAWEDFRKATRYDSAPLELVIIGIINTPRPNGAKKRAGNWNPEKSYKHRSSNRASDLSQPTVTCWRGSQGNKYQTLLSPYSSVS